MPPVAPDLLTCIECIGDAGGAALYCYTPLPNSKKLCDMDKPIDLDRRNGKMLPVASFNSELRCSNGAAEPCSQTWTDC